LKKRSLVERKGGLGTSSPAGKMTEEKKRETGVLQKKKWSRTLNWINSQGEREAQLGGKGGKKRETNGQVIRSGSGFSRQGKYALARPDRLKHRGRSLSERGGKKKLRNVVSDAKWRNEWLSLCSPQGRGVTIITNDKKMNIYDRGEKGAIPGKGTPGPGKG